MKTNAKKTTQNKKKKGFTLIEVIAVLVLLGILAAIAVPQYLDMADNARETAVDAGIAELNSREALEWGNALLTSGDPATAAANTNIGADYTVTATTITFDGLDVAVYRTAGTTANPALWQRGVAP